MTQSSEQWRVVAKIADIPVGERLIVKVPAHGKQIEVGVFNVGGEFYAYRNVCPHAGAPICQGKICGTTRAGAVGEYVLEREGEIVRCPWHGWEFDLLTGAQLVDAKMKLKPYQVAAQVAALETFEVTSEADCVVLKLP